MRNFLGGTAEPVSGSICVPGRASSAKVMLPELGPIAVGAKDTLIVHPWPTPSQIGQLLVFAKGPVIVMLLIESGALPELVNKIDLELPDPTACGAKSSLDAEKLTAGALYHTEAITGTLWKVLDALLNCIRSKLPSLLKSPAMNLRGK